MKRVDVPWSVTLNDHPLESGIRYARKTARLAAEDAIRQHCRAEGRPAFRTTQRDTFRAGADVYVCRVGP